MAEYKSGMFITKSLAMNSLNTGGAIIGIKGNILGAIYRIRDNKEIILGRDPYCSDIVLYGKNASRKHCSVTYLPEQQSYRFIDYSMNGCYLCDGIRLERERPYKLDHGMEILLGSDENVIKLG